MEQSNEKQEKSVILCGKCGVEMIEKTAELQYLKYNFTHKVPTCPICGQVYISEKLVNGKIKNLEKNFEEK